tara:strand:- start:1853 stop:2242 length:390 start_codon:yes stop_codon:yes gene_type:complete
LKKLKDKNLTKITVSYSGGGDDGCIDDYTAYHLNEKGEEDYIPYNEINLDSFSDAMDDYIYSLLSNTIEWDWINNSGGYGELTIDLEKQSVSINHNQNTVEEYYYTDERSESLKEISEQISNGTSLITQ